MLPQWGSSGKNIFILSEPHMSTQTVVSFTAPMELPPHIMSPGCHLMVPKQLLVMSY